jgi:hypothetical protein
VKVTKQVVVSFSIAKYADKVTSCWGDHGPWQYDRKAIHDGVKNMCAIVKDGKIITHVPLTPKQVYDDQIKLKREHEVMGREDQGEEQGERRSSYSTITQTTTTPSATHPKHKQIFSQHSKQIRPFNHYSKTPNLTESEGKTRGVKKVRKGDEIVCKN